jgi:hypothetical protein
MFRFDAKKGFYLHPQTQNVDKIELRMKSGSTYENNVCPREDIMIIKCGLFIPNDAIDYEDFKVKIKRSEEIFKNRIIFNT